MSTIPSYLSPFAPPLRTYVTDIPKKSKNISLGNTCDEIDEYHNVFWVNLPVNTSALFATLIKKRASVVDLSCHRDNGDVGFNERAMTSHCFDRGLLAMPAASMFAAFAFAPVVAHQRGGKPLTRAFAPRRGAVPVLRASSSSWSSKRTRRVSGTPRCLPGAAEDTAKATGTTNASSSRRTIDALSALLGVEDAAETERRREEAADSARAAAQTRVEQTKAAKSKRLKQYLAASTATSRLQKLQVLFLDMPLVPLFAQSLLVDDVNGESTNPGRDAAPPNAFDDWFDVAPPSDASRSATTASRSATTASATVDQKEPTLDVFGSDVTPAYTEYTGIRLPNEFSIPVVPYPYACLPGSLVRLNLFEPRWLTLFAKLLTKKSPSGGTGGSTSGSTSGGPSADNGLVLEGARDGKRIDLGRNPLCAAYEAEENDGSRFDIVPGFGRLEETDFVGTETFGALFRAADGRVAGVGTRMKVEAHDVVVDGSVLSVYAKGYSRFKVLRVRQVNPYLVVDAVPILEDEFAENVQNTAAAGKKEFTNNVVSHSSNSDFTDTVGKTSTTETTVDSKSAKQPTPSAAGLARIVERLITSDAYYSNAVGLGEAWRSTDLKKTVLAMSDFDVANAMLYAKPEMALAILACEDAKKRKSLTENLVFGMEASVALGVTPRKARLLKSLAAFAVVFAIGFGIAYVRDVVEANWGQ